MDSKRTPPERKSKVLTTILTYLSRYISRNSIWILPDKPITGFDNPLFVNMLFSKKTLNWNEFHQLLCC
jgi:hypothetical protein